MTSPGTDPIRERRQQATSASMLCAITICVGSRRLCWRAPRRVPRSRRQRPFQSRLDRSAKHAPRRAHHRILMRGFQSFGLKLAMKMLIPAIGRTTSNPITITRILRYAAHGRSSPRRARSSGARRQRLEAQPRARAPHARQQVCPHRQPPSRQMRRAHANVAVRHSLRPPSRHPGPRGRCREWARPACARKNRS